jgi:hypothetical protein
MVLKWVVLEISNIRTSIQLFNDTEKVVHTMDTLCETQYVTFMLTLESEQDSNKNTSFYF